MTATALVNDKHVPVASIIEHLGSLWGTTDVLEIFRKSYQKYHGPEALESAERHGFLENDMKYYERGELPECVVAMYYHSS